MSLLNDFVRFFHYRVPFSGRYLGCSKDFDNNDYNFVTNGGTEDGYAAIKAAIDKVNTVTNIDGDNLADCADIYKYIIFVSTRSIGHCVKLSPQIVIECSHMQCSSCKASDEDRDNTDNAVTYESTLQLLQTEGWTFHAILNNPILDSDGIGSVEQSRSQWKVYDEDTDPKTGSGYKETIVYSDPVGLGPGKPDYTGLAYGTDGAVWDLNKLREGGFTTKAFGEIFVNTTTEIIIDDIASNAPTMSPRPFSPTSPAPSRNPVTTAPTAEPNLCSTTNVLACVKNTSEATFRAVLRIMLQGVLNETELSGVIPSLADELNSKAVQLAVQAQLCLFLANPLSFDVGAAAASIFSATLGSLNPVQLAKVTLDSITSNIDLTPERGFKLLADLGAIFTQGVDPNAVVGDLFTILINAIQQSVFECLGLNLPAPPPPAPTPISNWFCFSGHATVEVQGQGTTRMDELKIGDSILAVGGLYSTVYSFGHFEPSRATAFLQIFAEGMIQPIEITPDHLLYMRSNENDKVGSIVPAGHVKVGDFLVTAVQPL